MNLGEFVAVVVLALLLVLGPILGFPTTSIQAALCQVAGCTA